MLILKVAGKDSRKMEDNESKDEHKWHYHQASWLNSTTRNCYSEKEFSEAWKELAEFQQKPGSLKQDVICISVTEPDDRFNTSKSFHEITHIVFEDEQGIDKILISDSDVFLCSHYNGATVDILARGKRRAGLTRVPAHMPKEQSKSKPEPTRFIVNGQNHELEVEDSDYPT